MSNTYLNEYDKQAADFLTKYSLTIQVRKVNTKNASWAKSPMDCGNHYNVVILDKNRRISFDFWGSINDKKTGQNPSYYTILSCLSSDIYCPETFKEFCADFGYDYGKGDFQENYATFKRCSSFSKRLREFFTKKEQEELTKIQ